MEKKNNQSEPWCMEKGYKNNIFVQLLEQSWKIFRYKTCIHKKRTDKAATYFHDRLEEGNEELVVEAVEEAVVQEDEEEFRVVSELENPCLNFLEEP